LFYCLVFHYFVWRFFSVKILAISFFRFLPSLTFLVVLPAVPNLKSLKDSRFPASISVSVFLSLFKMFADFIEVKLYPSFSSFANYLATNLDRKGNLVPAFRIASLAITSVTPSTSKIKRPALTGT